MDGIYAVYTVNLALLGCIFHVRLSTTSKFDHAVLYGISVELPAHRAEKLNRVLVVASPVNDINLHAWDINKVKRFIELDIGVRMELCHSCYRGRSMTTTFIMEKQFVKDCVAFLCKQAQITDSPAVENGLFIYNISHHKCFTSALTDGDALTERGGIPEVNEPPPIPPRQLKKNCGASKSIEKANSAVHVCINGSNELTQMDNNRRSRCFTTTSVDVTFNTEQSSHLNCPLKPVIPIPEHWDDYTGSDSTDVSGMESVFMTDGSFTKTQMQLKDIKSNPNVLPPRTIPRKDHKSSIPATKQLYCDYQPHIFNNDNDNKCFDAPYQISSRIIIKDSGEVQFERNVMGNQAPKRHGGFHFKQQIPIPPRGLRADSHTDSTRDVHTDGKGNDGDKPLLQADFDCLSNVSTDLTGSRAQFSHDVSASVNAQVGVVAPPLPPRPSHTSSSSQTCLHRSSRTTCKSPVPLPRSKISSSSIRKSQPDIETENEAYDSCLSLLGDPKSTSHLVGHPKPTTFGVLTDHEVTFGASRTSTDSELESHAHNHEASDSSDLIGENYVYPNTPPLTYSRPESKTALSPSYTDESQFVLETTPDYLKLIGNERDGQPNLSNSRVLPSNVSMKTKLSDGVFGYKIAALRDGNKPVCTEVPVLPVSTLTEPDDKECDFEDAASIAFIQSSYRQRCASSGIILHDNMQPSPRVVQSFSTEMSLDSVKPEVRPRKAKEPNQQKMYENSLPSSSFNAQSRTGTVLSVSDQSLLDPHSYSREANSNKQTVKLVPRPLPCRKMKATLVLSKSLNVLSSSDSNLLDSIKDTISETNLDINSEQKSTSFYTNFFLDETGIGVSEL